MMMNRLLGFGLLFFLVFPIYTQVPFPCKGQFFISHSISSTSPTTLSQLSIHPVTQEVTFEVIKEFPFNFNAMGFRSTDQLIYAIDPNTWNLYRIDADGNFDSFGIVDHPVGSNSYGGGITPDGRYLAQFAINFGSPNGASLVLIDLQDPSYSTTIRPVIGEPAQIFDLAFDPTTGEMYGVDSQSKRLFRININSGIVESTYPNSNVISSVGGLFFDSFGQLYAYGAPAGSQEQAAIFSVDKSTGVFSFMGKAPTAAGNDACSCPYTIKIQKSVSPKEGFPCASIQYHFEIVNQSALIQTGIDFQDVLPVGMTFDRVIQNPFGGVVDGIGTDIVSISDMTIPLGAQTIMVEVNVGDLPAGQYSNQAVLFDLPVALGTTAFSDDPTTIIIEDSTVFTVISFSNLPKKDTLHLCAGNHVVAQINDTNTGVKWSTGAIGMSTEILNAGTYTAEVQFGCVVRVDTFVVIEHDISVVFDPDYFEILLGNEIILQPLVVNTTSNTKFVWETEPSSIIGCSTCPQLELVPSEFSPVLLTISNDFGCSDQATVQFKTIRRMFIPNSFTPNADDINDTFRPEGSGIEFIDISIFDRWGGLVYQYKGNYDRSILGWNGRNNHEQIFPQGVYTWKINLRFIDSFEFSDIGTITLLR